MNKKGFRFALLLGIIMLLAIPISAQAATGSKATGAKLPSYKKVVTRTVDGEDFSRSLRLLLDEARRKATNKTQYKIIIPPGKYEAIYTFNLCSNVHLYAKGATMKRVNTATTSGKCVFVCDPGKSYRNIKIEGGTWDASSQPVKIAPDTALVRLAHMKNLIFQNVTFKCKRGGHIIELSDINGLTIRGCKLSGNTIYRNVQPKEAIQLDVATRDAMVNCTPYNGKGCHNVLIEKNKFTNVARGVGSHNVMEKGVEKSPYTNVTVRGNSFKNLKGEAIFVMNWKNCTIENNTIFQAKHAGVYANTCSKLRITWNKIQKLGAFTGARRTQYGAATGGVMIYQTTGSYIAYNSISRSKGKAVYDQGLCAKNTIKKNKKK